MKSVLNAIGERNPQLFRELKGRLTWRNIAIASVSSLAIQLLLLLCYLAFLPKEFAQENPYCLPKSSLKAPCVVDWVEWWFDVSRAMHWMVAIALIGGGVYLLISDLAREERRGTLNFIRLSPQSTPGILTGKLLGVPVLLFLGAAIALPFHLWSAIAGNSPFTWFLSFYALLAAYCLLFYSAAILYALIGGSQGWIGASGAIAVFAMLFQLDYRVGFYTHTVVRQPWYGLPIGFHIFLFRGFISFTAILATYWIWQALHRCFRNQNIQVFSKKQSYGLVACIQLFLLGFMLDFLSESSLVYEGEYYLFAIFFANFWLFICLIALLSPPRQTLQDWARYSKGVRRRFLWQDLLWGEKSPAAIAIAVNIAITAAIFIPWISLWPVENFSKYSAIITIIFGSLLMLCYAMVTQMFSLMHLKHAKLWGMATAIAATALPLFAIEVLMAKSKQASVLFLLTMMPFLGIKEASATQVVLAFLSYVALLAGLSAKLNQQLNRLGESTTKALLRDSPSRN